MQCTLCSFLRFCLPPNTMISSCRRFPSLDSNEQPSYPTSNAPPCSPSPPPDPHALSPPPVDGTSFTAPQLATGSGTSLQQSATGANTPPSPNQSAVSSHSESTKSGESVIEMPMRPEVQLRPEVGDVGPQGDLQATRRCPRCREVHHVLVVLAVPGLLVFIVMYLKR